MDLQQDLRSSSSLRATISALLLVGSLMISPQGAAQDDSSNPTTSRFSIDEIVVTGTKRDERAQDVPIAVTAISDEQLARTFRTDILAVSEMSPGVTLGLQPGFRAIAGGIRGTGQNSILVTQDSSVVLLLDEFATSNVQAQFVELFDIDQIEVFRGPQGTLFGKSATGGAISITTKRPEMNEFFGEFDTQIGQFQSSDAANGAITKVRGALNIPIIDNVLSARIVGILDTHQGFFRNDKDTATFPDSVPIWDIFFDASTLAADRGVTVADLIPPKLNQRTRGTGEKTDGQTVFATNVKLLFQPNDIYEAYFKWEFLRDRSDTVPGVNETPAGQGFLVPLMGFPGIQEAGQSNPFSTGVTNQCPAGNESLLCVRNGHEIDVDGFHLHQRLNLGDYTVRLLSSYREQTEVLPDTFPGEAFLSIFDASRNTVKEDIQLELRIASNLEGPFNFVAGASYAESKVDMLAFGTVGLSSFLTLVDEDRNDGLPPPILDDRGFLNLDLSFINDPGATGARQDRETYAFYADGSYEITDKLTFSAGVRYTKDDKKFFRRQNPGGPCTDLTPAKDQVIVDLLDGPTCLDARSNALSRMTGGMTLADVRSFEIPLPDSVFGIAERFSDSWDEFTFRTVFDYRLQDDVMTYLSFATGFIPGRFTETCSSLETCQPFDSETNWNIEGSLKAQFLDNRLQTNLAIFYTRYEDLIRSQVLPFTNAFGITTQETVNVNAGESEAYGAELEVQWIPRGDLIIDFQLGYLQHEYIDFELDITGDGVLEDLSNLDVPFSPRWKIGAGATFEQPLSAGFGHITYNVNANYQSSAEVSVFNADLTQMQSRFLLGANLTWRDSQERYRVTLWGTNLLDKAHRVGGNSVAGLWNFTSFGRPRAIGAEFGVSF